MEAERTIPSEIKSENTYFSTVMGTNTIITFNIDLNVPMKNDKKHILIVLDKSGSMSGSKMNECKIAIKEIAKLLYSNTDKPNFGVITFDNNTQYYDLRGKTIQQANTIIDGFNADGGTQFIPVFNLLKQIVNQEQGMTDLAIILMSDGQAERLEQLKAYIEDMKKFFSEKLSSSELHTLGFGGDHDARLLEALTKSAASDGTFQYIRESKEIQPSLEALTPFLLENRIVGTFTIGGKSYKATFKAKKNQPGKWESTIIVDNGLEEFEKLLSNIGFTIRVAENDVPVLNSFALQIPTDEASIISFNFQYLNQELKRLTDVIVGSNNRTKEENQKIEERLSQIRLMQSEIVRNIFKVKISEREQMMEASAELTEYISTVASTLRQSMQAGLTNDQIASVNALAYRSGLAKNKLKVLDKRLAENADLMNQVKANAQKASAQLKREELEQKYSELTKEIGCCPLSLNDFIEAILAEDCLCMTMDIARPEIAITDASKLIIKKIHPSFVSASTFLDSVKYKLNFNVDASGKFETKIQGEIVKGAANESITAVIPIYITPEHWSIAREYMKPIIAWNATLDPLGYDYNQIRMIPFLVLERAVSELEENPDSDYSKRIYKLILQTCIEILKNDKELVKKIKNIWLNYESDGTLRGVEEVQSNGVLLAYIHCLEEMGELPKLSKEEFLVKFRCIIEEEMRRRQRKEDAWNAVYIKKAIKNLIGIDSKTLVDKLEGREETEKKKQENIEKLAIKVDLMMIADRGTHYKKIFEQQETIDKLVKEKSKTDRVKVNQEEKKMNEEKKEDKNLRFRFTVSQVQFDGLVEKGIFKHILMPQKFADMEKFQKELATETFSSYTKVIRSYRGWLKSRGFDKSDFKDIESIGIQTPFQILTLNIQNKIHHKNIERLESFKSNDYCNPFDQVAAEKYVGFLIAQMISDEYTKIENSKPKDPNYSMDDLAFFAFTDDLEAAAGMLVKNFDLGSFERLQNIFRSQPQDCKLVLEKLLMIRNQEYKSKKFELDFKMRKKWVRALYSRYKNVYKHDEWKELWWKSHDKKNFKGANTGYVNKGNKGVRGRGGKRGRRP